MSNENKATGSRPAAPDCSACEAWRERWISTRRYLRAANKGAERNAMALELSGRRLQQTCEHLQKSCIRNQELHDEIRKLKKALHDAIRRPMGVVPESAEEFYQPNADGDSSAVAD